MRQPGEIHHQLHKVVAKHNRALSMLKFSATMTPQGRQHLMDWVARMSGVIQALEWVRNPEGDEPEHWSAVDRLL